MKVFTIGADPELFLLDKEGQFKSIVGLLGGSKEEPLPIGNGCAVQEDNVAAEFCIPPASSVKEFQASIQYSLSTINERAYKLGLTLANLTASACFPKTELRTPQAQVFGCDPDYNAYTGRPNPRPRTSDKTLRSAGGHVHVGTDLKPEDVIKTMDLLLGVPSVLIDEDYRRRNLYGKAGAMRYKPYGAEYRTLSNFWIWSPETIEWVYHQTKESVDFCEDFNKHCTDEQSILIQACINSNNKEQAKTLIKEWGIKLP